jgi:hypothetical protein
MLRESGERILGKIQNRKAGFVRLGNLVRLKLEADDEEKKFASLMQIKIWKYYIEEALIFFCFQKI